MDVVLYRDLTYSFVILTIHTPDTLDRLHHGNFDNFDTVVCFHSPNSDSYSYNSYSDQQQTMESTPTTCKTYEAKMYEQTMHGKMRVGTVLININDAQFDLNKYSSRLSLEELTEVKDVSSFEAFDFPLFEYSDTHVSVAEQSIMQPTVNEANNHVHSFSNTEVERNINDKDDSSDFVEMPEDDEGFHLEVFEEDALIEDVIIYENEFVPINHPFHIAGVKVNRKGEVILDVDEETLKTSRLCFMDRDAPVKNNNNRISKQNKYKSGPIVSFEIYRNHAWLKVGDFHLATEVLKTFRPQFVLFEIEVVYFDANCNNCHLDNLVAKVKTEEPLNPVLPTLPQTGDCTFNRFWDGEFIANSISFLDGRIASIDGSGNVEVKKIAPKEASYAVNISGMKFDARKIVWRAFTNTTPTYSSEHYKIHMIDETKKDKFRFDNLRVTLVSSIFEQWSTEDEKWPWTRSKRGVLPKTEKKERTQRKRKTKQQHLERKQHQHSKQTSRKCQRKST